MKKISPEHFKKLIVVEFFLVLFYSATSLIPDSFYGPEAQSLLSYSTEPSAAVVIVVGVFAVIYGIWTLQNLLALYKLKQYARKHALIITGLSVVWYFVYPFEPYVELTFASLFYDAYMMLWGAILAIMYFTSVADYFEK